MRERLVETITAEIELGGDLRQALARVLEIIRLAAGAVAGHLLWRDLVSDEPVLISSSLWCSEEGRGLSLFQAASEGYRFHAGAGLPGWAMEARAPVWITDVTTDPRYPRAPFAAASGLFAAFAFPAIASGNVVAVLEFYLDRILEPDEALLRVLGEVGSILGPVIAQGRETR